MDNTKVTFSVTEAAGYLGIGRALAYRLIHEGKLPVLRLGSKLRVSRVALDAWLLESSRPEEVLPQKVG